MTFLRALAIIVSGYILMLILYVVGFCLTYPGLKHIALK